MEFTNIGNKGINLSGFVNLEETQNQENLEKGGLYGAFGYAEKLLVKKTGKEIKEGLSKVEEKINTKRQTIEDKKEAILADIVKLGCVEKPDQDPYYGEYDGTEGLHKTFSWKVRDKHNPMKNEGTEMVVSVNGTNNSSTDKTLGQLMSEYNLCAERLNEGMRELSMLSTLKNNLQDKAVYELNTRQLQAAGL